LDWVDQICRLYAFHGLSDRIDVVEIAYHDFGTELFQSRRSIVFAVDHGADSNPERD
jgi:hypothetical protein